MQKITLISHSVSCKHFPSSPFRKRDACIVAKPSLTCIDELLLFLNYFAAFTILNRTEFWRGRGSAGEGPAQPNSSWETGEREFTAFW